VVELKCDEASGSIESGEFLEKLSYYQLLKNDSSPYSMVQDII
jgi:hypothetical protein